MFEAQIFLSIFCVGLSLSIFITARRAKADMHGTGLFAIGLLGFPIALFDAVNIVLRTGVVTLAEHHYTAGYLWLGTRFFEAAVLMVIFSPLRVHFLRKKTVIITYVTATLVIVVLSCFVKILPASYTPGFGDSVFRTICEYVIMVMMSLALLFWHTWAEKCECSSYSGLGRGLWILSVSTLCFALGMDKDSEFNVIAYVLRIIGLGFFSHAIAARGIGKPYKMACDALNAMIAEKSEQLKILKWQPTTVQEYSNKLLRYIIRLTGSSEGYIFFINPVTKEAVLLMWLVSRHGEWANKEARQVAIDSKVVLTDEVLKGVKSSIVNERYVEADSNAREEYSGISRFVSVPIVEDDRVVAVVGVADKNDLYTDTDILNMELLFNAAWSKIASKRGEEDSRRERRVFESMLMSLNDGIIATDEYGRIIHMNYMAEKLTGWRRSEAEGLAVDDVFVAYIDQAGDRLAISPTGVVKKSIATDLPQDVILRTGRTPEIYIGGKVTPGLSSDGTDTGMVLTFHDITFERKRQRELENMSYRDPLTDLYNRRFFEERIEYEMTRSIRHNESLSLILFDIDRFKNINDTWGHPVGDEVLKQITDVAKRTVREVDLLVRFGGEEFLILMPHTDLRGAIVAAEKLRKVFESTNIPAIGVVTASFGVAEYNRKENFTGWYRRLDAAMYKAKNEGRNKVAINEEDTVPNALINIKWMEEWECGHARIDEQHKELLYIANEMIAVSLKSKDKSDEIIGLIDRLIAHVAVHFEYEETVLNKVGYPLTAEHAEIHQRLVDKALKLKKDYENGEIMSSALFTFIVGDVVLGHMFNEDRRFFGHIRASLEENEEG